MSRCGGEPAPYQIKGRSNLKRKYGASCTKRAHDYTRICRGSRGGSPLAAAGHSGLGTEELTGRLPVAAQWEAVGSG